MITNYVAQGFKNLGFKITTSNERWTITENGNELLTITNNGDLLGIKYEVNGKPISERLFSKKQTTLQDVITFIDNQYEIISNELDAYEHTCRNNWDI